VAAVVRALERDDEVQVASPRPSAAHLCTEVAGITAGNRLNHVHRLVGRVDRLVLGMERELPVPVVDPGSRIGALRQRLTVTGLRPALRKFGHVTFLVTGDLAVPQEVLAPLWPMADEVLVSSSDEADRLRDRFRVPPTVVGVVDVPPSGGQRGVGGAGGRSYSTVPPGAVTALGPVEVTLRDRPRQALGLVGRAVLGRRAPAVQQWLTEKYWTLRAALRRLVD
jgi:hypothetical protein